MQRFYFFLYGVKLFKLIFRGVYLKSILKGFHGTVPVILPDHNVCNFLMYFSNILWAFTLLILIELDGHLIHFDGNIQLIPNLINNCQIIIAVPSLGSSHISRPDKAGNRPIVHMLLHVICADCEVTVWGLERLCSEGELNVLQVDRVELYGRQAQRVEDVAHCAYEW